jgi:hypothetical protein
MHSFFHSRIPSLLFLAAFVASSLMLVYAVSGAAEPGYATPEMIRGAILWGGIALLTMLGFCICLAIVTRYRRSVSEEEVRELSLKQKFGKPSA